MGLDWVHFWVGSARGMWNSSWSQARISPYREKTPRREENKLKNTLNVFVLVCVCLVYFFMVLFVTWGFFHCNSFNFSIRDHTLHYNIGQGPE